MAAEPRDVKRNRRHRPRPTPKWLREQKEIDAVAQRRCLMLLSVLSGEKPVTDAISEAQISRQMYYQLEQHALEAMIRALTPGGESESGTNGIPVSRVAELEAKVTRLEREKRRAERLLLLTRKTVQSGTLKQRAGRPRKKPERSRVSMPNGNGASSTSTPKKTLVTASPSTPPRHGADVR